MFLIALLFAHDATATQVLDRATAFRKAHPMLSVDFSTTRNRMKAEAHMVVDRDVRMYVRFEADRGADRIAYSPAGYVEINDASKVYDEFHGGPQVRIMPSRISGFAVAIPSLLFPNDVRGLFPKATEFKSAGKEVDFGVSCDVLHTHITTQMGQVDIDLAIDGTGRFRRIKSVTHGMAGNLTAEWRFSSIEPLATVPASLFTLAVPLGYVPYTLHDRGGPIPTGSTFPARGWRAASGGALDVGARLGAHGGLVAILGADSEPSDRARASLARLRGNVPVVTLSDEPRAATHDDGYDPSGKLIDDISPADTPLFLLLNGKGKIVRLWMGYDADHASAFEQDVRKTYSGF